MNHLRLVVFIRTTHTHTHNCTHPHIRTHLYTHMLIITIFCVCVCVRITLVLAIHFVSAGTHSFNEMAQWRLIMTSSQSIRLHILMMCFLFSSLVCRAGVTFNCSAVSVCGAVADNNNGSGECILRVRLHSLGWLLSHFPLKKACPILRFHHVLCLGRSQIRRSNVNFVHTLCVAVDVSRPKATAHQITPNLCNMIRTFCSLLIVFVPDSSYYLSAKNGTKSAQWGGSLAGLFARAHVWFICLALWQNKSAHHWLDMLTHTHTRDGIGVEAEMRERVCNIVLVTHAQKHNSAMNRK